MKVATLQYLIDFLNKQPQEIKDKELAWVDIAYYNLLINDDGTLHINIYVNGSDELELS